MSSNRLFTRQHGRKQNPVIVDVGLAPEYRDLELRRMAQDLLDAGNPRHPVSYHNQFLHLLRPLSNCCCVRPPTHTPGGIPGKRLRVQPETMRLAMLLLESYASLRKRRGIRVGVNRLNGSCSHFRHGKGLTAQRENHSAEKPWRERPLLNRSSQACGSCAGKANSKFEWTSSKHSMTSITSTFDPAFPFWAAPPNPRIVAVINIHGRANAMKTLRRSTPNG